MSRFKSNLYTIERRVWRNHKLCWIQNDDFTLFSGHHKTKIKEEDLPEWYVFGRYYKLWGLHRLTRAHSPLSCAMDK